MANGTQPSMLRDVVLQLFRLLRRSVGARQLPFPLETFRAFLYHSPPHLWLICYLPLPWYLARLWLQARSERDGSTAVGVAVLSVMELLLFFLLLWPKSPAMLAPHRRYLAPGGLVIAGLLALLSLQQQRELLETLGWPSSYRNDAVVLTHQAAENLLAGKNPYASAEIMRALEEYHLSPQLTTPLRQGAFAKVFPYPKRSEINDVYRRTSQRGVRWPVEFESQVSYPAGSFLVAVPVIALGFRDLRPLYLAFLLLGLFLVGRRLQPALRPFLILGVAGYYELWAYVNGGSIDLLYVFFLLLGWMTRKEPASAVWLGLAAACKQLAWFYLPFYFILVHRESDRGELLRRAGVIAGVFLLVNLPFVAVEPEAWLSGVLSPLLDSMFPLGIGVVGLTILDVFPPLSSLPFLALEMLVLALGVRWFSRTGYRYPASAPILAVAPLYVAWRSLPSYFYPVPLLVLCLVLLEISGSGELLPSQENLGRRRLRDEDVALLTR